MPPFQTLALPTLAFLALAMPSLASPAFADTASPAALPNDGKGPKMNSTLFSDAAIRSVTAVTQVFGQGQILTAAVVELAAPIKAGSVTAADFAVEGRQITGARVTADPAPDSPEADGRHVILSLDPADPGAMVFGPRIDTAAQVALRLTRPLSAEGTTLQPGSKDILSTRLRNLGVEAFQTFRFTDPETGLALDYNLFIPSGYDPAQPYPLVMFLHDAGVTGSNPGRSLQQGLGAIAFASPEDQARHPSFVLAPQFPVALVNDAAQTSVYVEMLPRLLADLQARYALDKKRLYTTGQSGGCMTSLALGISHPDLFAGTLCIAGQWEPALTTPPKGPFWGVVSQDDTKAFPGMGAIMDAAEAQGSKVMRADLDAKAPPADMAQAIAAIRAEAGTAQLFFTPFVAGSVLDPTAEPSPGAGHVRTWRYAYDIPALRDWLFAQSR